VPTVIHLGGFVRSLFAHFFDEDLSFSFSLLSITSARAGWWFRGHR